MSAPSAWRDAQAAAALFARDPLELGGVIVRAGAGPQRDAWCDRLKAAIPPDLPLRRMPVQIGDEALLGGLDLAATLAASRPVMRRGLIAEAAGGIVIAAMAERMAPGAAAHLAAAIDRGAIGLVALDEGVDDEAVPAALAERAALRIDLTQVSIRDLAEEAPEDPGEQVCDQTAIESLCGAALLLGIDSARAPLLALRAARGAAALAGRRALAEADLALAMRLVLAPRATRLPAASEAEAEPPPAPSPPERDGESDGSDISALTDLLVAAARAALPADVLAAMERGAARGIARGSGRGAKRSGRTRGRPAGVRAGDPGRGLRLSLVDTLRAAAPWQALRRSDDPRPGIQVRRSDFRVKRYEDRAETIAIFVVDASGSAALERLAETKGAVELLLAEAYVRRTQVALVAFRGAGADTLLPPTRSLARAKKCLADLAGGGGTPLAAGLAAGQVLAEAEAARGRTPLIVLMTDGRANVTLAGAGDRAAADTEALAAARRIRGAGIGAVLIDIAPRPRPEAAALAVAMDAHYAPLPRVEAGSLRDLVAG